MWEHIRNRKSLMGVFSIDFLFCHYISISYFYNFDYLVLQL